MQQIQRARVLVASVVAAVAWTGCGDLGGGVGATSGCPGYSADAGVEAAGGGSSCRPPDGDGIQGGCAVFDVTVDDTGFHPFILKSQNLAQVTLTLRNTGSRPHDLVFDCIPDSEPGCGGHSCFAVGAHVAALAPGKSATVTLVTPNPEGIYTFHSDLSGDSQTAADGGLSGLWGQFVVQ